MEKYKYLQKNLRKLPNEIACLECSLPAQSNKFTMGGSAKWDNKLLVSNAFQVFMKEASPKRILLTK
ncbi:hypothetical protein SPACI_055940 [Sporomusa acidovorans DSM 3132]|uniref:Uncharacterized protein n=1 Tax=Sporomusa acidovorans (strain ATCC 49682 / DSM 3132 / Mol) TaxID=1123286 RepID=A0ABZ3JAT1_SPOA4|nr:hypothetical protein SPACI_56960 [Sporomusa acidovorans DSM 3132]SDE01320.1 hypothetical protein SAMN04488499_1006154 [Sporomusa acidovorans]